MNTKAWSYVAVSAIARAMVDGSSVKRPPGMPRRRWQRVRYGRRWQRVRYGRRWSKPVQSEARSLAYIQRIAAEDQRLGRSWGVP